MPCRVLIDISLWREVDVCDTKNTKEGVENPEQNEVSDETFTCRRKRSRVKLGC